MARLLIILLLSLITIDTLAQQSSSPKREAIRQFIFLGSLNQLEWNRISEPIVEKARKANPDAPATVWEEFRSYLKAEVLRLVSFPNSPIERAIDRFEQKFSESEIRQITNFFQSDLGKRFVTEALVLNAENETDQQWLRTTFLPEINWAIYSFYSAHKLKNE